mgnify:CR=1 FL=1
MFFWKNRKKGIRIEHIDKEHVYAPITGKILSLEQVNDVVFSQKMMGDGVAIEPEDGMLYSPVKGKVSVVFPTGHVIGIEAENGANIILHVGIDTVELKGRGFEVQVHQGDMVEPGDALMKIDLPLIRKNYAATTMVVIENSKDYQMIYPDCLNVKAGEELLRLMRK